MSDWYVPSGVPLEGSTDTDDEILGEFIRIERSLRRIDSVDGGAAQNLPLFVDAGGQRLSSKTVREAQSVLGIRREFFVYKSDEESKTQDTTLAADSTLSLELSSGYIYAITILVNASFDDGFNFRVSFSGTSNAGYFNCPVGGVSDRELGLGDQSNYIGAISGVGIWLKGLIAVAESGDVTFDWAQLNSSTGPASVGEGSFIRAVEVISDV